MGNCVKLGKRAITTTLLVALTAGLVQPAAATAVTTPAPSPAVVSDDPPARPMPPDPYQEWDGKTGIPDNGDPRYRQLVEDNAELADDVEVREAAKAALAGGRAAIMAFLNGGLDEAKQKAEARKAETDRRNRAAIEALRGTGGSYLQEEVARVLAGTPTDRADFIAFGRSIAEGRDAEATQDAQQRADQLRARVQMLVGVGGPEVKRPPRRRWPQEMQRFNGFWTPGISLRRRLTRTPVSRP
jgi:hypothetical protein